jgi:hypothetical protein
MNIHDYIYSQNTINKALHAPGEEHLDFALFASIFSEQMDLSREHIQADEEIPVPTFIEGIEGNTHKAFHLKAEAQDYKMYQLLNDALQRQNMLEYKLLQCMSCVPLSLHDDHQHIDDDVLSNCSMATQQTFKQKQSAYYDAAELGEDANASNQQQPAWLHDIIEQSHQQFQNL